MLSEDCLCEVLGNGHSRDKELQSLRTKEKV